MSTQLVSTVSEPRLKPALKRDLPKGAYWSIVARSAAVVAVVALLVAGPQGLLHPNLPANAFHLHPPTFAPLLSAGLVIQLHVVTVIGAAIVGLMLMTRLKGTTFHRTGGYIYMAAMFLTGIVTLFIPRPPFGPHIGPFGPLHLFSLIALIGVPAALWYARQGKWMIHGRIMGGLFVGGIGIAGIGAFTPGRIMWSVFFG